ncbi:DUF1664 domain-containing protein [Psidium guajava]|nr:DUF1664 domain-containing protein [Psidium guajava]
MKKLKIEDRREVPLERRLRAASELRYWGILCESSQRSFRTLAFIVRPCKGGGE